MAEKPKDYYAGGAIEVDCAHSEAVSAVEPTYIISKENVISDYIYDASISKENVIRDYIYDASRDRSRKHDSPRHVQPEDIATASVIESKICLQQTDDKSIVERIGDLDIRSDDEKATLPEESCSDTILGQIYQQDQDGDTYLHCAIILREADIAMQMIQVAPSHEYLNIYNKRRQTPLHLAVITDQWEVARHLVVCGAQLDLCDYHGNTALHIACRDGKESCVCALTYPILPEDEQDVQIQRPQQSIPQDCNTRTYSGETCLHLAARHKAANYVTIINHLINYCGADVNKQEGKSGRTILHMCAEANDTYLMRFLTLSPVADRLNINAQTWDDKTAYQLAKSRGHQNVLDILISSNADTSEKQDVEEESDESNDDVEVEEDSNSCT